MNSLPNLVRPTVHLNGTAGSELVRQVYDAARAIDKAIEAFADAAPNARDYYPQGDDAYTRARNAHGAHLGAMRRTYDAVSELYETLMDTGAV